MEKLLICTFKKLNKLKKGQEILKWEVNNLCNIHVSHLLDFKKNVNIQKCIHLNQTAHDTHNFTHLKITEILTFISQTQHTQCCNLGFI